MPFSSTFNPITPFFTGVTSGQFQIPAGSATYIITAVSGGFYANGVGPYCVPTVFWSDCGTRIPINVGCSGGNVSIFYQRY